MKVYAIIRHKSEKPKLQLNDMTVFEKKSDAKRYLKDIIKDIKDDEGTWFKDDETYIVTEKKTGKEYTLFIQELEVR